MTKREKRYLLIIGSLLLKIDYIIRDTNLLIDQMEQAANAKLDTLLKKQVEADTHVLVCWEDNLDTVIKENEIFREQVERLQRKLKVKKRVMREVA